MGGGLEKSADQKELSLLILILLADIGFVVSLMVHVSTFLDYNPSQAFYLLHAGIFLLFPWISDKDRGNHSPKKFWLFVTRAAPAWMRILCISLSGYALFNFFYTLLYLNEGGAPAKLDGVLVLHSHGHVIRELTDQEFQKHMAYVMRGFSAWWMFFYSASMMIIYVRSVEPKRLPFSND